MEEAGKEGPGEDFMAGAMVERLSEGDRVGPDAAKRILLHTGSGDSSDSSAVSLPRGEALVGAWMGMLGVQPAQEENNGASVGLESWPNHLTAAEDEQSIRNSANALDEDSGNDLAEDESRRSFAKEGEHGGNLEGTENVNAEEQLGEPASETGEPQVAATEFDDKPVASGTADASGRSGVDAMNASESPDDSQDPTCEGETNGGAVVGPLGEVEAAPSAATEASDGQVGTQSKSPVEMETGAGETLEGLKTASRSNDPFSDLRDSLMEMERAVGKLDALQTIAASNPQQTNLKLVKLRTDALDAFIGHMASGTRNDRTESMLPTEKVAEVDLNGPRRPWNNGTSREARLSTFLNEERFWMKDTANVPSPRKGSNRRQKTPELRASSFSREEYILIPVDWRSSWIHANLRSEPSLEAYQAGFGRK